MKSPDPYHLLRRIYAARAEQQGFDGCWDKLPPDRREYWRDLVSLVLRVTVRVAEEDMRKEEVREEVTV